MSFDWLQCLNLAKELPFPQQVTLTAMCRNNLNSVPIQYASQ
jgi:hypothetical protein